MGSDWLVFCDYGFTVSVLWCPLAKPTFSLGFLLPWTWGISSQLLHQSAAAIPFLGRVVSPPSTTIFFFSFYITSLTTFSLPHTQLFLRVPWSISYVLTYTASSFLNGFYYFFFSSPPYNNSTNNSGACVNFVEILTKPLHSGRSHQCHLVLTFA